MTSSNILEKMKHPLPLSILAGILNGTSYIPFPPWALFFCLTPLLYIWLTEKPHKVFLYTLLTYFIGVMIGFFWINHLLQEFAHFPFYVSLPIFFVFSALLQIHIAFAGLIWAYFMRHKTKVPILGASAFFALFFYIIPTLFPWHYGYTWLYGGLPAYHFADIIGFDGLNIITILLNGAFLWAFLSPSPKQKGLKIAYLTVGILVFNLLGYFYAPKKLTDENSKTLNVTITQANIGNFQKHYARFRGGFRNVITNKYLDISQEGLKKFPQTDLLVWPETAFPEVYRSGLFLRTLPGMKLQNFLSENQVNLISGFYVLRKSGRDSNSAMFWGRQGQVASEPVYKKILLAFGEYLPFEKQLPWLRKIVPMAGNFEVGREAGVRKLDNINYGIQICYESLYPKHTKKLAENGAQIIVNLTNDSWYGKYSQPQQHLYLTAGRAVESRRPLIRSTNTGISTVVLPSGQLLDQSPLHKEGAFHFKVPYQESNSLTLYHQFGWRLPLPFILILVILSLFYGNAQSRLEEDS